MDNPDHDSESTIGHDLVIEGNIKFRGSLLIEGEVTGNISGPKITVGSSGKVNGDIVGEDVVFEGHLIGNFEAETISIRAQSVVSGDLAYGSLAIEHGARFEGAARKLEKKSKQNSS